MNTSVILDKTLEKLKYQIGQLTFDRDYYLSQAEMFDEALIELTEKSLKKDSEIMDLRAERVILVGKLQELEPPREPAPTKIKRRNTNPYSETNIDVWDAEWETTTEDNHE